jgi:hypothetical protein
VTEQLQHTASMHIDPLSQSERGEVNARACNAGGGDPILTDHSKELSVREH